MDSSPPSLNPALRDFWLKPARNRVLVGGRASSKSWDAAGFATFLTDNYKLRVLCVRQFQNKISESVYALLKIQIERFGLRSRFDVQRNKIISRRTGSEFMFYGLWRSIDEIKSLESIDILWIEEAHNLTEEQWKILEPTIRKQGSQVWVIFNPKLASDFAYQRFVVNPPPDTIVRQINYDENIFLSSTMLSIIKAAQAEDEEEFRHIYLGEPKADDEGAVIRRSWAMAAIDAHKRLGIKPAGAHRMGFDVADSGDDKCATVYAHGPLVSWCDMWSGKEDELLQSCSRVYQSALPRGRAKIIFDSIGVGASAGAKFGEINQARPPNDRLEYDKFNAGGAVSHPDAIYAHGTTNRDMFSNAKAQAWWLLADRFKATYAAINGGAYKPEDLICLDSSMPHIEKLIDELCTPRREYDPAGRVKVESKKDLAKRDVKSPNLADALVMAYAPVDGVGRAGIFA